MNASNQAQAAKTPANTQESAGCAPVSCSPSGLSVAVLKHPKGFLMRIEQDGASLTLDRSEALDLYEKLRARLGEMPVKI